MQNPYHSNKTLPPLSNHWNIINLAGMLHAKPPGSAAKLPFFVNYRLDRLTKYVSNKNSQGSFAAAWPEAIESAGSRHCHYRGERAGLLWHPWHQNRVE